MIISTDLDGTLLNSQIQVPESTAKYLNELKNKGELIVINTGRNISSAMEVTNNAWFANYVIGNNGSSIFDVEKKSIIKEILIDKEIYTGVFNLVKEKILYFDFCSDTLKYRYSEDNIIIDEDFCQIINLDDLYNNEIKVSRMICFLKDTSNINKIADEIKNKYNSLYVLIVNSIYNNSSWLDIINIKTNKYNGLIELKKALNLDDEKIISFGDETNDIDMIAKSHIGIAMKNANQEVKSKAKYITEFDNNNLGVENWLRNFIDN